MNFSRLLGITSPFDPAHKHVTSPLFPVSVLAGVRLLFAFYTLVTLLIKLIWDSVRDHDSEAFFSYFTNLSYIGLCAYFFTAGVQTIAFARSIRMAKVSPLVVSYPLQRWHRPLQFLHLLLEATIVTFPVVVTIVYWVLLASSSTFDRSITAWSNISIHIFNTVFSLTEIFLTNIPPMPWLYMPCGIIILGGYLGVAYITQKTQGFYTYSFLNPQKQGGLLAAYLAGIAVGYCVIFIIIRFAIILRIRVVAWYVNRRSGRDMVGSEALDEWTEVEGPTKEGPRAV